MLSVIVMKEMGNEPFDMLKAQRLRAVRSGRTFVLTSYRAYDVIGQIGQIGQMGQMGRRSPKLRGACIGLRSYSPDGALRERMNKSINI